MSGSVSSIAVATKAGNFLRRGDNPLLSHTLREGAKRQWRLLCTDRSGTEMRSDFDGKMSAKLTKITHQVEACVDLKPIFRVWNQRKMPDSFFLSCIHVILNKNEDME